MSATFNIFGMLNHFATVFAGKIKTLALTNFDTERLRIILDNEIPVVSNQVIQSYRISCFYFNLYGMCSMLLGLDHTPC